MDPKYKFRIGRIIILQIIIINYYYDHHHHYVNRPFFVKPFFGPRYFFCKTQRQGTADRGTETLVFLDFHTENVGLFYGFHDFYFFDDVL